ncbi:MAG: flagellar hook-basal body complex protein [Lawsonibacter sp.]|nr:flagellar hook-basal body complex protein [Lawsonibacter sp.]
MTGAMYAAVSGLKAHMSALNVIGNNIANVNTLGYKSSRFTFLESLYTSVRGGSDGTTQVGGKNPAQIGYGCSIGTIDLDMSTKNYSPTGQALDCMIDGDGFLMVGDKDASTPESLYLTRLGNLGFDPQGYLTDGQGQVVYGFLTAQKDGDANPAVSPTLTAIRLPMASTGTEEGGVMTGVGEPVYPKVEGEEGSGTVADATENVKGRVVLDSVSIDETTGRVSGITSAGTPVVVGYLAIGKVDNPNGVTHVDGHYYQALDGAGTLHVTSLGGAVKTGAGDKALTILSSGKTALVTGGLESSGTDLASEITSMITVQRGYQANTRIITVTDSMLEELVNMKR